MDKESSKVYKTYNKNNSVYEKENKVVHRGEIRFAYRRDEEVGSEVKSYNGRPCIIVSRESFCEKSGCVNVVYLTTAPKEAMNTHVVIANDNKSSTAICEQVVPISKSRLGDKIGMASDYEMIQIDKAMAYSLQLEDITEADESTEIVKLKTERDTYKKMYDSLINRITK